VTAFILNIRFECRDPSATAQFWSAVTGYSVDPESLADRVRAVDRRAPWPTL